MPYTHTGSRDALLGVPANAAQIDSLSNQKWVTEQTPQTFLAHGDADDAVPIENSRMFDSACKAFNVPDTLVVDPGKGHGYGMAGLWPDALKNWMEKRGLLEIPIATERFHATTHRRERSGFMRYSPARGVYFAGNSIRPDEIKVFTIDGTCLTSHCGVSGEDFSWKPPTRGMYLARVKAGKKIYTERIIVDKAVFTATSR